VKWVVWDFDGTLAYRVGQWPAWTQALLEVLDRKTPGHGIDPELLRSFLSTGFTWHSPEVHHQHLASADAWWGALEPRFAEIFRAAGAEEVGEMASAVRRAYLDPERWRLYEDALPALEELTYSDWKHALLTNHVPELPEIAGCLGLDLHVERIFNSAQTGYEKPHPKAFRGVLDALGGAEEVWMVGDNADADVAGAKAAGIPAILVRKRREGVEPYCENLGGIAAIVDG
jgi:putative hydrolase of the HAD superfamily